MGWFALVGSRGRDKGSTRCERRGRSETLNAAYNAASRSSPMGAQYNQWVTYRLDVCIGKWHAVTSVQPRIREELAAILLWGPLRNASGSTVLDWLIPLSTLREHAFYRAHLFQ